MAAFIGTPNFSHATPNRIGILLTNLGTPQAPTPRAVRRYLAEFLSDHRVVELPRILWLTLLHGVILRIRPKRSAKVYASIWGPDGSPLLTIAQQQLAAFQAALQAQLESLGDGQNTLPEVHTALGMRYGKPSIASALETLRQAQCERIIILPLYPQYASATTGSTFDAVSRELIKWRWVPELHFINHYHDSAAFIRACAQRIKSHWDVSGKTQRLLLSYHGVPEQHIREGDPYHCQCHKTSRLIAQALDLDDNEVITTFQSRFGKAKWLEPYTDKTLMTLAKAGTKQISVFCPGFSADCLETLEEIAVENRGYFLENGGERFDYIPCLNDQPEHIQALVSQILPVLRPWLATQRDVNQCQMRAKQLGANQ